MLTVVDYELIRRKHFIDGESARAIAKELGHSRRTVAKAIANPVSRDYLVATLRPAQPARLQDTPRFSQAATTVQLLNNPIVAHLPNRAAGVVTIARNRHSNIVLMRWVQDQVIGEGVAIRKPATVHERLHGDIRAVELVW